MVLYAYQELVAAAGVLEVVNGCCHHGSHTVEGVQDRSQPEVEEQEVHAHQHFRGVSAVVVGQVHVALLQLSK